MDGLHTNGAAQVNFTDYRWAQLPHNDKGKHNTHVMRITTTRKDYTDMLSTTHSNSTPLSTDTGPIT